jgi:hypothetical protein
MPRPLKVSEKGAPLTCPEHDANIDRLLDRANHTGTQSASTIYDLPTYIQNLNFITGLTGEIDDINSSIQDLQHEVLGTGGHVDTLIKGLESAYKEADLALHNRLSEVEDDILDLRNTDVVLQNLIDGLTTRANNTDNTLGQHQNTLNNLTNQLGNQNTSLQGLDGRVDELEGLLGGTDISSILGDLSIINGIIRPIVEGNAWVVPRPPNGSDGLIFAWDANNNEPIWRFPDFINGGLLIDDPGTLRLTLNLQP